MIADFYLMTNKNLNSYFQAISNAKAPSKFTTNFLIQLGFKSTGDRLFIQILKGLAFLDSNGVPTERYFQFLDNSQSKYILTEAIKEAYADLFQINIRANEMSESEVKNKLKTIFQGKKSDDVMRFMAKTFKGLCELGDFNHSNNLVKQDPKIEIQEDKHSERNYDVPNYDNQNLSSLVNKSISTELHYNIQIHLPETKDIAVYDAIFESLKKHLL
ncbi:DUF5343 domain-containing protein [Arcicella aquatica]|uniref:DUF5343 domain-containing protein n=1 Tax=Arcicella aquatica TaxID=217141 RepID=A0ABU5QSB7_9BACT|nr:DUF5343 domain-containing protein [Arcicella aquatica]MEA5259993.1 DUF5343 domain-containing protein [Arcicella aquatica]